MKNILTLITFFLVCIGATFAQEGDGTPVLSGIKPLSSAQMRADAIQEAVNLQVTFEGISIDWNQTTNVWEPIPRPTSGKRSIDDIRNAIIGQRLSLFIFDPNELIKFKIALWGEDGLLLEGVRYFQLEKVGDDYVVPDWIRYIELDLPEGGVDIPVGDALFGKLLVKDKNGDYQEYYFQAWGGKLRGVDRGLLDQAGILIITREFPAPDGHDGSSYVSYAYDPETGESVEAVHSSTEVQNVGLAGWMRLAATELNVVIEALDSRGQIPNIETLSVPCSGWYRLDMVANNHVWGRNGSQTMTTEKPKWVTLRFLDTNELDLQILPDQNGVFWIPMKEQKRYHIIPGDWPTLHEREVPAPTPGKG